LGLKETGSVVWSKPEFWPSRAVPESLGNHDCLVHVLRGRRIRNKNEPVNTGNKELRLWFGSIASLRLELWHPREWVNFSILESILACVFILGTFWDPVSFLYIKTAYIFCFSSFDAKIKEEEFL
jgi:hypothetical protein